MDCGRALESIPAHLSHLQCLQTKSLVTALPFLGVLHLPNPNSPPAIVTSDMLLWCLRHIFLMFYTPYNPRCAEKAHFTCWHNWWCLWPCMGQAHNEVFITTDTVRTREQTRTHRQSDVCRRCRTAFVYHAFFKMAIPKWSVDLPKKKKKKVSNFWQIFASAASVFLYYFRQLSIKPVLRAQC